MARKAALIIIGGIANKLTAKGAIALPPCHRAAGRGPALGGAQMVIVQIGYRAVLVPRKRAHRPANVISFLPCGDIVYMHKRPRRIIDASAASAERWAVNKSVWGTDFRPRFRVERNDLMPAGCIATSG